MRDKQLIIIGGGTSIKEGEAKGLWTQLNGKFTFGLNFSYNFFKSTAQMYVDKDFYVKQRKDLDALPLVIGKRHEGIRFKSNVITFKTTPHYDKTLNKGVYKCSLCGLFALSVGIFLQPKEIFLLGYDYGDSGKIVDKHKETHFYQGKIEHRGIGKVNYYNALNRADRDFGVYAECPVPIYNVSMNSKIKTFPKLSYDEFFKKLHPKSYSQDELRKLIIPILRRKQACQKKSK